MVVRKKPAVSQRRGPLRLVVKTVGVDSKGWQWVATWRPNREPDRIRECITDVIVEKRKEGKSTIRKRPTVQVGKSGQGRCELRCPRGMPQPWSGPGAPERHLRARFVAWLFARRPKTLTLRQYLRKNRSGQYLWAAA